MITSLVPAWLAQAPTTEELKEQIDLDSQVLLEQFYFWTVVVMWLIHVGFMAYEAGAARRKNVMSTAMKNILTIAVVTPTFYYFGWYIYGCFEEGLAEDRATPARGRGPRLLRADRTVELGPWAQHGEPNLAGPPQPRLLPRVPPLLVDDGVDHVRRAHRARAAVGVPHPRVVLGSVVWIMDAAWGWSGGGWLTTRFGFHDSIASLVVHGVAGAFTLGVLLNLGPRIGKYDVRRRRGASDPTTRT